MSTETTAPPAGQTEGSWLLRTAVAGVLLLAAGAFVLSYSALHAVAVAVGINPDLAGLYPLIIDGFLTIASLAALHLRDHGPKVTWYPWALLGGFFTVSVWCNALHAASRDGHVALTGTTAALVSAMPPVALGLAVHLLILMLRPPRATKQQADTAVPATAAETSVTAARVDRHQHRGQLNGSTAMQQPGRWSAQSGLHASAGDRQQPAAEAERGELRRRAAAELRKARDDDSELTGAELGRRLGISTRHGRRLLHDLNGQVPDAVRHESGALALSPHPAEEPRDQH